jgi:hypothetical protein
MDGVYAWRWCCNVIVSFVFVIVLSIAVTNAATILFFFFFFFFVVILQKYRFDLGLIRLSPIRW